MANKVWTVWDPSTGTAIPILMVDNGDGTYSEGVNGNLVYTPSKASTATSAVVTADGTALASNSNRKAYMIQNLDDAAVYVKLGSGASSSSFSFVLKAGGSTDDGTGGAISDSVYTGIITIAAATGSPRVVVVEM